MNALEFVAAYLAAGGKILTVRVSSAQARGAAKKYAYYGAVRYELRLVNGAVSNCALERASSDRRSRALAEADAEQIARREGRFIVQRIGRCTSEDLAEIPDLLVASFGDREILKELLK